MSTTKRNAGFTLVEMIVSIGIIGLLAAIGLPSYLKFAARARQSEAKIALASLHTAQTSFFLDRSSFTQCLNVIGANLIDGRTYYATVINVDTGQCGPVEGVDTPCTSHNWDTSGAALLGADCSAVPYYNSTPAFARMDASFDWETEMTGFPSSVARRTFVAVAIGSIARDGTRDVWTINESKRLINLQQGL